MTATLKYRSTGRKTAAIQAVAEGGCKSSSYCDY